MIPAMNPTALAAATLSLGAHAAVFGILLLNSAPADKPSEVVHLVNIVAASAAPSPPIEPQAPVPSAMSGSAELLAHQQGPEPHMAATQAITPAQPVTIRLAPHGEAPAPAFRVAPKSKPLAPAPDREAVSAAEPQEIARLDPAAPRRSPPRSVPNIETEIAIVPGNTQPKYPLIARKRGYEGQAIVRLQVSERGQVLSTTIASSSGYEVLDRAARNAVKAWQFQPATRDGRPSTGLIEVPIEFRLHAR